MVPHWKIGEATGLSDSNLMKESRRRESGLGSTSLTNPSQETDRSVMLRSEDREKAEAEGKARFARQSTRSKGQRQSHPPLTLRENQVMGHLGKGLLYKEIADKMGISFTAVHKLQHKIFVKLHVGNRTEAVNKWKSWHRL